MMEVLPVTAAGAGQSFIHAARLNFADVSSMTLMLNEITGSGKICGR